MSSISPRAHAPCSHLLLAAYAQGNLWMPANGAHHGVALDRLMNWNLAAIAILFLLSHVLLVIALLRRRRATAPPVWLAGSLPLALLCVLYVTMAVAAEHLWAAQRFDGRFEGPSLLAMQVEVTGVQFQWYFRYPGEDATFGETRPQLVNAAAANPLGLDPLDDHGKDDIVSSELVLPVGREVDLRLHAQDVIHGLFIPGMRLKQNAVPGLTLHVHFTPETVGEYAILCTQVCGLGHGHMQARLRVLPPADFGKWLAQRERKRLAQGAATGGQS